MSAPQASAREGAAAVLGRILTDAVTLDVALAATLKGADVQRHSAIRSLSYGAVRGYFRYMAKAASMSAKPVTGLEAPVRAILSVAFFELEEARSPQYAVVDAAVQGAKRLAPRAAGLVNALLRRYLRERATIDAAVDAEPLNAHAAPAWLAERFKTDWPARWRELLAVSDSAPPMWLRVNARRSSAADYAQRLEAAGMACRLEPRVPQAVLLEQPCDVHALPDFAQGAVSVQDLGAQCVQFPLALQPQQSVLDACAAPGGKTALIAEREPDLKRLWALDVHGARLERVRENLARGGLTAEVRQGDAGVPAPWWDGEPFDRILLDVPCSALGVIRRHPDIKLRKSPADLEKLPATQLRLLQSAWGMLGSGGRLVYATCTITRSENRDVIAKFLDATPAARVVPPAEWSGWPDIGERDETGCQILPGEAGADGFYYAALTRA